MFLKEETEYMFRKEHLGQRQEIFQNLLLDILGRSRHQWHFSKREQKEVKRVDRHCHLPCWSWPVQVVLYCWSWIWGRTSCPGHSYGIHISLEYETTKRNTKFFSYTMIPKHLVCSSRKLFITPWKIILACFWEYKIFS